MQAGEPRSGDSVTKDQRRAELVRALEVQTVTRVLVRCTQCTDCTLVYLARSLRVIRTEKIAE